MIAGLRIGPENTTSQSNIRFGFLSRVSDLQVLVYHDKTSDSRKDTMSKNLTPVEGYFERF